MGDLFNGDYPAIPELAADTPPLEQLRPGDETWCGRCQRPPSKGNICFLNDAAMRAYCVDLAIARMRTMAQHMAVLPADEQRAKVVSLAAKIAKMDSDDRRARYMEALVQAGWPEYWCNEIRREAFRLIKAAARRAA